MRAVFKGFLMLRLLAFIPMAIVIVVLVGVTALEGGSDVLGIAILAAVPVIVVAALGLILARRATDRQRSGQGPGSGSHDRAPARGEVANPEDRDGAQLQ